jgi:hypothetical protein
MNRRDAIKAAVAGVATCALPAAKTVGVVGIEAYAHHRVGKSMLTDVFAKFSDGSQMFVCTDQWQPSWYLFVALSKDACIKAMRQGHAYWHRDNDYGRWIPVGLVA